MSLYHRPDTLDEALKLRAAHDLTVLAGGTDIYPGLTPARVWGGTGARDILDITAIDALRGIAAEDDHFRIGALATWSDLVSAGLPAQFDGLKQAALEIGGRQIQNRGTIAGNICNASPAADGTPCLMALDAKVELASARGTRRVALEDFFTGYRAHAGAADELVTAIIVPRLADGTRAAFVKLGARAYLVISIVMAAAVIEPDRRGRVARARIVIGACSEIAQTLPGLEQRLEGMALNADLGGAVVPEDVAGLAPIDDPRASADYRRAAAVTVLRDLLMRAAGGERQVA